MRQASLLNEGAASLAGQVRAAGPRLRLPHSFGCRVLAGCSCQRLCNLSRGSRRLWAALDITLGSQRGVSTLAPWLHQRRRGVAVLTLRYTSTAWFRDDSAGGVATVLAALAGGALASLCVNVDNCRCNLGTLLRLLPALRRLCLLSRSGTPQPPGRVAYGRVPAGTAGGIEPLPLPSVTPTLEALRVSGCSLDCGLAMCVRSCDC